MGADVRSSLVGKVDLELTQFYDFVAFHLAYLRPLANGLSTDPPLFVVSTQLFLPLYLIKQNIAKVGKLGILCQKVGDNVFSSSEIHFARQ